MLKYHIMDKYHTHFVFSQSSNNQGTNHARKRPHPVRNAHQDAGIARSNVQMIDIKTWQQSTQSSVMSSSSWHWQTSVFI